MVIVHPRGSTLRGGFKAVESGFLSYDGETLTLESDRSVKTRELTPTELARILAVSSSNQIPECLGYQLYILNSQTRRSVVDVVCLVSALLSGILLLAITAWIWIYFTSGFIWLYWLPVAVGPMLITFGPRSRSGI